jgi:multiple sugar transport system permease protein
MGDGAAVPGNVRASRSMTDQDEPSAPWQLATVAFFVALAVVPIAVVVGSSFKLPRDIFSYRPIVLFEPTLENYASVFTNWPKFVGGLVNSAIVTASSIALVLLIALPAAYAFSRFSHLGGIGRSAVLLFAVKMLPPLVVTVPLFPIFSLIGLDDTRTGLVLVYAAFELSLSVMLLKTMIDAIPPELEEAALIDGCGRLQAFRLITLPLIRPGIVTVAIFVTLFVWNDYLFALVLTTANAVTAPVVLADMLASIGEGRSNWGEVFAAATVQLAPVLVFTVLVQRRMLRSGTAGGLKG